MKIVLGVTGSIAAYKALEVLRLLKTNGAEVKVVMTTSASQFVGALSFEALSGEKVNQDFWSESDTIGHIALADYADLVLIAPATADCIAKLNHGITDNSLLGVCLATKAKIVIAPAMNCNMYENPITQENLRSLKEKGFIIIEPESGELACGWIGNGRLAEPKLIVERVLQEFKEKDLQDKKILITAGATVERIDSVRYISNFSSGKMGCALAAQAVNRGAVVDLVYGQIQTTLPGGVSSHKIESAENMLGKIQELRNKKLYDVIIFTAAVADYRAKQQVNTKIKKQDLKSIDLELNPDIAKAISENKKNEVLVGFALETGNDQEIIDYAKSKLETKNLDLIVANRADEALGRDTNHIWIIDKKETQEYPQEHKLKIANHILDRIKSVL